MFTFHRSNGELQLLHETDGNYLIYNGFHEYRLQELQAKQLGWRSVSRFCIRPFSLLTVGNENVRKIPNRQFGSNIVGSNIVAFSPHQTALIIPFVRPVCIWHVRPLVMTVIKDRLRSLSDVSASSICPSLRTLTLSRRIGSVPERRICPYAYPGAMGI